MELARVIGTVVATQKYEGLDGVKLLLLEALDEHLVPHGEPFVACDHDIMAGPGDVVTWIGGREATLNLPTHFVPVDASIVSIVDDIDLGSSPEVVQ
jgi:microcompartment protein CcmK/EutM